LHKNRSILTLQNSPLLTKYIQLITNKRICFGQFLEQYHKIQTTKVGQQTNKWQFKLHFLQRSKTDLCKCWIARNDFQFFVQFFVDFGSLRQNELADFVHIWSFIIENNRLLILKNFQAYLNFNSTFWIGIYRKFTLQNLKKHFTECLNFYLKVISSIIKTTDRLQCRSCTDRGNLPGESRGPWKQNIKFWILIK
jgi:hypothetical protein